MSLSRAEPGAPAGRPDLRARNPAVHRATDCELQRLVADVLGLIEATTKEPVVLVGHDWGGVVAWLFAHEHPDRLRGLVIINAPHPDVFRRALQNPAQRQASQYMNFLISPEAEARLSANNFAGLLSCGSGCVGSVLSAEQRVSQRRHRLCEKPEPQARHHKGRGLLTDIARRRCPSASR